MKNTLANSKALVTGINSSIGCEIGCELAKQGAHVVGTFHPQHKNTGVGLDEAHKRISAIRRDFTAFELDQTRPQQIVETVARAREALKGLDVLVTVASVQSGERFMDMNALQIQQQIAVNLTGTILLVHEAAKHMIAAAKQEFASRRHRAIGIMGSVRGRIPVKPDPYEFAKAGLHHMVAGLANELGEYGISINGVAPGTVDSPIEYERYGGDENAYRKAWETVTPLKRQDGKLARPQDVAEAMVYLLGAERVTGEMLGVDGGYVRTTKLPMAQNK